MTSRCCWLTQPASATKERPYFFRPYFSPCLQHNWEFATHRRRGPWRSLDAVEFATLEWVDWFNHRRLLEPIGYIPPAEYEARYYEQAAVA